MRYAIHLEPREWIKNEMWLYTVDKSLKHTVHGDKSAASRGGSAVDVQLPYYSSRFCINWRVLVQ
jgi:hypothetical protein